jgi:hypothetical protein
MKKCKFGWFFLHMYITTHGSENVKLTNELNQQNYGLCIYVRIYFWTLGSSMISNV